MVATGAQSANTFYISSKKPWLHRRLRLVYQTIRVSHGVYKYLGETKKFIPQDNIKKTVAEACDKLPQAISPTCHSFVESYGDAVIALLIQEIDPKDICPKLYLCSNNTKDVEVFAPEPIEVTINAKNSGSEKCPLCLFAVQEAVTLLKNDKSTVSGDAGYIFVPLFYQIYSNSRKTLSVR